jgi:hypothetical protein
MWISAAANYIIMQSRSTITNLDQNVQKNNDGKLTPKLPLFRVYKCNIKMCRKTPLRWGQTPRYPCDVHVICIMSGYVNRSRLTIFDLRMFSELHYVRNM